MVQGVLESIRGRGTVGLRRGWSDCIGVRALELYGRERLSGSKRGTEGASGGGESGRGLFNI
jgi:hypothetical protein